MIPRIVTQKHGNIPVEQETQVLRVLSECYSRLRKPCSAIIELQLFETAQLRSAYSQSERLYSQPELAEIGERYVATHDAWKGTPRIAVCMEHLTKLAVSTQEGVLRHEVGHSVLHGNIEYYVFQVPPELVTALQELPSSATVCNTTVYLISTTVKDIEVTKLLALTKYESDQLAYAQYVLAASDEDLKIWRVAQGHAAAEIICLLGRLRDLAPSTTLMSLDISNKSLKASMEKSLSYFPTRYAEMLRDTSRKLTEMTGDDTHRNVADAARIVSRSIIQPLIENPQP